MAAMSSILIGGAAGLGMFSSLMNAKIQSEAMIAQGKYQEKIAQINTEMAEMNALDAIDRGDIAARDYQKEVNMMIGEQKVAYAGQGVDVNFGSAAMIEEETRAKGAMDAITIRNNAWREAWGYKVEAINSTMQGQVARMSSEYGAKTTMLTGGLQALQTGLDAGGRISKGRG